MLLSLAIRFQNTALCALVRDWPLAYPIILTLHLIFISLFAATILATDLRLLGWALRKYSISEIVNQLRVPKRIGFVLVVTCGLMVFGSKAEEYYYNPFLRVKFLLLALVGVHALVFRGSVYNNAAELDASAEPPMRARLAAGLSLLLWLGIAIMGRSAGYVYPPAGTHHFAKLLLQSVCCNASF
jgi:hypothetical protein